MSDLAEDFAAVSAIGRAPEGGWSRPAYGAADVQVHDWLMHRARAAGLAVRMDAAGNVIARLEGAGDHPAVGLGSHLDTVTNGGAYDGVIGTLTALDVLRRAAAAPEPPSAPLELICFRDEEGRFGAFTGSRAMTGQITPDDPARMRDAGGTMLTDALAEAGLDPQGPARAARDLRGIGAFLELHIEQGQVLEQAGVRLGIVTAIAGQRRLSLRFAGAADHAGTTPMDRRHDAFAAAARFADRFRDLVIARGEGAARGTIGIVSVEPNQGNVVPALVRMGLELRDSDAARLAALTGATERLAAETAADLGVTVQTRPRHASAPVPMAPALRARLAEAATAAGIAQMPLLSGANHDAGILGAYLPAAMVFVPSRGGRSHCPEEHTDWPDIEAAAEVMYRAALALAGDLAAGRRLS